MHMVGPDRLHGFGRRLLDDKSEWVQFGQGPVRTPQRRGGRSNSHVTECGPGPPRWLDYDSTVTDLSERFLQDRAANPYRQALVPRRQLHVPALPSLRTAGIPTTSTQQDRIELPEHGRLKG